VKSSVPGWGNAWLRDRARVTLPQMIDVPSAPAESRPPYITTGEEIRRWDLCVAVAPKVLGEDATAAELWQATRLLFNDPVTYPTE